MIPRIVGTIGDDKCVAGGIPFGNLESLTDGTLKSVNPDIHYGARLEKLAGKSSKSSRGISRGWRPNLLALFSILSLPCKIAFFSRQTSS